MAEQLQWALGHRVLIEQAKGVLMEREGLSPAAAFERLRATARSVGRTVVEVAGVVLAGGSQPRRPQPGQTGTRPSTESRPLPLERETDGLRTCGASSQLAFHQVNSLPGLSAVDPCRPVLCAPMCPNDPSGCGR